MTCESCGCVLDEDDMVDWNYWSFNRNGTPRLVKVVCPACDHIQLGKYASFNESNEDGPWDVSVDGEEYISGIENDWWPGYIDEDDSD